MIADSDEDIDSVMRGEIGRNAIDITEDRNKEGQPRANQSSTNNEVVCNTIRVAAQMTDYRKVTSVT